MLGTALFARPWPAYFVYVARAAGVVARLPDPMGPRGPLGRQDPQAADVSGVDVNARRRQAILLCGADVRLRWRVPTSSARSGCSRCT